MIQLLLRNGFILSQLDGEGMRVVEDQQKRHIKEVYMDSALRSLASDRNSDSASNFSFENAHTQNTATERINAMLTESINARKAEYFDLSGNDMEPQHELYSSSSPAVQNYNRNRILIDDCFNSIRDLKHESMLRGMESERRSHETIENNTKMFQEELFKIHGEHDIQSMQSQQVVNDLLRQMRTQVSPLYAFSDKPKPLFPRDPVMQQHLRSVEMSQQSRQADAATSSNNDPESAHEKKDMLEDLETLMGYQPNHEKHHFIGKLNQQNSLEHN